VRHEQPPELVVGDSLAASEFAGGDALSEATAGASIDPESATADSGEVSAIESPIASVSGASSVASAAPSLAESDVESATSSTSGEASAMAPSAGPESNPESTSPPESKPPSRPVSEPASGAAHVSPAQPAAQTVEAPAMHAPAPEQVDAAVCTPPVQA
jgi:hypothetical protein